MEEQDTKNQDVIAGEPLEDDIITGATVRSARNKNISNVTTTGGGGRVAKNKARNKGIPSQMTSVGDVVVAATDKLKSVANPATKNDLIQKIKSIPDKMLPSFIKPYADIMVNQFGIDTREKAANFLGQISAESIRGAAEYVYYDSEKNLRKVFGNKVAGNDPKNFLYNEKNLSNFGFGITPWSINGLHDSYYGSRAGNLNGNEFNKVSSAQNPKGNVQSGTKPNTFQTNPGFYKGSPEGYAYRGHGVIQITGKVQYERMNQFFGVNGKYNKNNVDFVKNPELVSENQKFAFLSALMWWSENRGVYINQVSLATTKTITTSVRGNSAGYQSRHNNVERYYYFLVYGDTGDLTDPPTPKGFKPGKLQTIRDVTPILSSSQKESILGKISYVATGGDSIRITNDFVKNITFVEVPQMKKFGQRGMNFHRLGATQLKGLWNEWDELGLIKDIISFDGSFVPRFIRATSGANRPISSHTWGIAFDINASWNGLGQVPARVGQNGSVRLMVKSAIKWGFYWGGWWPRRPDGMHFEINRLDYR
jgi:predicted chitinase